MRVALEPLIAVERNRLLGTEYHEIGVCPVDRGDRGILRVEFSDNSEALLALDDAPHDLSLHWRHVDQDYPSPSHCLKTI